MIQLATHLLYLSTGLSAAKMTQHVKCDYS